MSPRCSGENMGTYWVQDKVLRDIGQLWLHSWTILDEMGGIRKHSKKGYLTLSSHTKLLEQSQEEKKTMRSTSSVTRIHICLFIDDFMFSCFFFSSIKYMHILIGA